MAEIALLIDTTKCMACRGCQVSCKQWWELPAVTTTNKGTYENPPDLTAETWTIVKFRETEANGKMEWLFNLRRCMHCTEAACVEVCPTYARSYDQQGFVTIDQERCIACLRCVVYCPFSAPRLGAHDLTPRIKTEIATPRSVTYNCRFCADRIADGLTPACAKTCPPGAIQFGGRDELAQTGRTKVAALKADHPDANLYGDTQLGGLHVMHILTEAPSFYELPAAPQLPSAPAFPASALPAWYTSAVAAGTFPEIPPGWPRPALAPTPTPTPAPVTPPTGDSTRGVFGSLTYIGAALAGFGMALKWFGDRKSRLAQERETSNSAGS